MFSGSRMWKMLAVMIPLVGVMVGCQMGSGDTATVRTGYGEQGSGEPMALLQGEKITLMYSGIPNPPPRYDERIREDGTIHPPYLPNPVQAAGLTVSQLTEELYKLYIPSIFKTITITVLTEDRLISITGEVVRPGRYPYFGETTAIEAISQAGGLTDFAQKRGIIITRTTGEQIRYDHERARRNPSQDVLIYPRDTIDVPRRIF